MTRDYIGLELFSGAIAHVSPDIKPETLEALRELVKLLEVNFMEGLIEGRIVHYVMPNNEHRAAMIVKVWGTNGTSNLHVFTDFNNDVPYEPSKIELFKGQGIDLKDVDNGFIWKTSVRFSETPEVGTWHWIEKD